VAGTSSWAGSHRTPASGRPRSWPPAATSPWCSPATPWARGWTARRSPCPATKDQLIAAVADANPRTVVVLNTGGPVLMPWLDQVGAVLQASLPGQQFGQAVAAVLFGDTDPGGRLPLTFPVTLDLGPVTGPERWPGTDGDARYDEGIFVGYRWYDQHSQQPLFCFGHGLSYGEFEHGEPRRDQEEATGAVTVSARSPTSASAPGPRSPSCMSPHRPRPGSRPGSSRGSPRSTSIPARPARCRRDWTGTTSRPSTRRRGPGSSTRDATRSRSAGRPATCGDAPASRWARGRR
jgi:beta-glucosidase